MHGKAFPFFIKSYADKLDLEAEPVLKARPYLEAEGSKMQKSICTKKSNGNSCMQTISSSFIKSKSNSHMHARENSKPHIGSKKEAYSVFPAYAAAIIFTLFFAFGLFLLSVPAFAKDAGCIEPSSGLELSSTTDFCKGEYYLDEPVFLTADNIALRCHNTTLIGIGDENIGNENGIIAINRENISITGCHFVSFPIAVYLQHTTKSKIIMNSFEKNIYALSLTFEANYNNISKNSFISNVNSATMLDKSSLYNYFSENSYKGSRSFNNAIKGNFSWEAIASDTGKKQKSGSKGFNSSQANQRDAKKDANKNASSSAQTASANRSQNNSAINSSPGEAESPKSAQNPDSAAEAIANAFGKNKSLGIALKSSLESLSLGFIKDKELKMLLKDYIIEDIAGLGYQTDFTKAGSKELSRISYHIYMDYLATKKAVGVSKRLNYNPARNRTLVGTKLIIKEPIKDLFVYEYVPKCIAGNITKIHFMSKKPDRVIEPDPLFVWYFSELDKGEIVDLSYEVEGKPRYKPETIVVAGKNNELVKIKKEFCKAGTEPRTIPIGKCGKSSYYYLLAVFVIPAIIFVYLYIRSKSNEEL